LAEEDLYSFDTGLAARAGATPKGAKLNNALRKEQRKLKDLVKRNQFVGVDLTKEINSQEQKVFNAKQELETYLESEVTRKSKAKKEKEKLRTETELRALEERSTGEISQEVELPIGPDGQTVSGRLTAETIPVKKTELEQKRTKTSQQEQFQESAYQRPLDSSQLRREVSGAGISIIGVNPNEMDKLTPTGVGRFALEGQDDELFIIPSPGSLLSSLVSSTRFARALYNLPANEVARYERTLGLTETGRMTRTLEDKIIGIVEEVSYLNYQGAFTGKPAIDWEQALIDPERFGLGKAKGTGAPAGPSPEQIRARAESIELLSTELGIEIDKNNIQKLARDWASGLFDANTIKAQIARVGTIDFNKGAAAETLNNLRQYASDLGVQYDETWYNKAVTRVLKYKDDIETYNNQIREIAKSQYPTLAEQIDSGFTVRQLASPYTQSMSRLLEIDPGTISLNDRTIRQALTGLNPEGKPMTTPLWQFEQQLRQDPRWNYTNNAQEELMGTARQVLKNFGLVG
jgi:hypothetical protein